MLAANVGRLRVMADAVQQSMLEDGARLRTASPAVSAGNLISRFQWKAGLARSLGKM
jgi:hypothetical protein